MRRCVRPSIVSCSGAESVCLGLAVSFDFCDEGKSTQSCVVPSAPAVGRNRRPCRRSNGHLFKGPLDQPDFVLGRRVQVIVSPEGEVKPRGRPWPSATIHFVPPAFAGAGSCHVWFDRHRTPFFARAKLPSAKVSAQLSWPFYLVGQQHLPCFQPDTLRFPSPQPTPAGTRRGVSRRHVLSRLKAKVLQD